MLAINGIFGKLAYGVRLGSPAGRIIKTVRRWATVASLVLATAAAAFFFIVPVYTGSFPNGRYSATLLHVNGMRVLIPLLFPVVLALAALTFRKRAVRIVAGILMGGFVIIGGFSIGLLYVPAAIAMLLAAGEPSA